MAYKLGLRSLYRLRGVHPDLVAVVKRAIEISDTYYGDGSTITIDTCIG